MEYITTAYLCFSTLFAISSACSVPEGGYIPPTPADNVHYAHHVLVGQVTEIITPDPVFGDMYGNSTYGAVVRVQCSYKGGPLTDTVRVGAAGFVPGLCTAKDLEMDKKVIIFLREKGQDGLYEQSSPAEEYSSIVKYLKVCDLQMDYPEENGFPLRRQVCPPPTKLDNCQRYGDDSVKVVTPKAVQNQKKPTGQAGEQAGGSTPESTTEGGDGGVSSVVASLTLVTLSVILSVLL